jgi:hypothetical protein
MSLLSSSARWSLKSARWARILRALSICAPQMSHSADHHRAGLDEIAHVVAAALAAADQAELDAVVGAVDARVR